MKDIVKILEQFVKRAKKMSATLLVYVDERGGLSFFVPTHKYTAKSYYLGYVNRDGTIELI